MKRFKFNLESLRRFKERQKQQLESQFAGLCRELASQQRQLDVLWDDLRSSPATEQQQAGAVDLQGRLASFGYYQRIRQLIAVKQSQMQQLRVQCAQIREQFLSVSKEFDSLETLRANQLAEHRSKGARQHQGELNDQVTNTFLRTDWENSL